MSSSTMSPRVEVAAEVATAVRRSSKRRPTPLALSDEGLDTGFDLCVKNTFLNCARERSPSLDAFFRERNVSTCPSSHIGRCRAVSCGSDSTTASNLSSPVPCLASKSVDVDLLSEEASTELSEDASHGAFVSLESSSCISEPMPQTPLPQTPLDTPCGAVPFRMEASMFSSASVRYFVQPQCPVITNGVTISGIAPVSTVISLQQHLDQASAAQGLEYLQQQRETVLVPPAPTRPAPGSDELPSMGSAGHFMGRCKPCAFLHTRGCTSGSNCTYCHLCEPGERKRRQKEKAARVKETIRAKQQRKITRDARVATSACE